MLSPWRFGCAVLSLKPSQRENTRGSTGLRWDAARQSSALVILIDCSRTWYQKQFFILFLLTFYRWIIFFVPSFLIHTGSSGCNNRHWGMAVAPPGQILLFSQVDPSVTRQRYWRNSWKYVSRILLVFLFLLCPSTPLPLHGSISTFTDKLCGGKPSICKLTPDSVISGDFCLDPMLKQVWGMEMVRETELGLPFGRSDLCPPST